MRINEYLFIRLSDLLNSFKIIFFIFILLNLLINNN